MRRSDYWKRIPALTLVTVMAQASPALAQSGPGPRSALVQAATLTLQYEGSERKSIDRSPLFGDYLGSGGGVGTGRLEGTITWDLYEDQSRGDRHPAHFHGVLGRTDGDQPFQIIGVFTPQGSETTRAPDGADHPRYWRLTGTILFESSAIIGVRHAPVTGQVDLGIWIGQYTVWLADPADQ